MDFNTKYKIYLDYFESELTKQFNKISNTQPHLIVDAMKYAVLDGGKRVRPVLFLSTCEILNLDYKKYVNLAISIELIHSYSLVHDDLPCMDNDDYRRGKFSTHKKFGENFGVLCGDALLNFAFETALQTQDFDKNYIKALLLIAEYAGYSGMIAGQVLDLLSEKKETQSEKELYDIYLNKTSKLLTAPLLSASICANNLYYDQLKIFGENIGYLFQIQDDILDVESSLQVLGKSVHKDLEENKLTAIKVFGLSGAKNKAEHHYKICKNILKDIENSQFLSDLLDFIYFRKK